MMPTRCPVQLSKDPSSVRRIIKHIPDSLVNVAPEKRGDVIDSLYDGNIEIEIIETRKTIAEYCPSQRKIRFGTRLLELLWAQAYAYYVFYTEHLANVHPQGQIINDPHHKPEVRRAMELLRWATQEMVHRWEKPYPADLPSPEQEPEYESPSHVAQELSLVGVGFILHHELAHYYLQHGFGGDCNQEKDADYASIDWIMENIDHQSPEYEKRALGSSIALINLVIRGIYTGHHGGESHPKDYNRLIYTIERHVPPMNDKIWAFIASMLSLHMQNAGLPGIEQEFGNFYEWCDALVDDLSRREREDIQAFGA